MERDTFRDRAAEEGTTYGETKETNHKKVSEEQQRRICKTQKVWHKATDLL